jgi:thioredoxin reductase (NADPH)
MKDLIIIGAGPAGLTVAIYGMRSGLDLTVIEKFSPGGQVVNSWEVENYPGFPEPLAGWELMAKMEEQARRLGAEITNGEINSFSKEGDAFKLKLADGSERICRSLIITSGASFRKIGIPGESEYTGRGVSYCATCDGAFFKDRVTAVIGGGDTALEEAIFLTKFSSKVYLIHRRDEFRAEKIFVDRVLANEKIIPVYSAVPEQISGTDKVTTLRIKDVKTNESRNIDTEGVFIFIGVNPNTSFVPENLLNNGREIIVDPQMKTAIPGLFAAGDVRSGSIRQIVAACGDASIAAGSAYKYLSSQN